MVCEYALLPLAGGRIGAIFGSSTKAYAFAKKMSNFFLVAAILKIYIDVIFFHMLVSKKLIF
jgi:hypothetical protein